MSGDRNTQTWSIRGLRTRYAPKSRLGHGMVSMAPWLDFVMLLLLFGLINSSLVLQPGVVVSLPQAPFAQGTGQGHVAVVLSVSDPDTSRSEAIVFFDDERFIVGRPEDMDALAAALAAELKEHPDWPLILQADEAIPQGTIVKILDVASGVGLKRVNMAVRPR